MRLQVILGTKIFCLIYANIAQTLAEGIKISAQDKGLLLTIIELGGYPDFRSIYKNAGYEVESVTSMRNATRLLKKVTPDIIVAEFNFQSDFRDRTSTLETLMAVVQRLPETRVIVFYEKEYAHQFEKLSNRFPLHATLSFPIDEEKLKEAIEAV